MLRSEKVGQGRFEPESFAVFGPKIIASRQKFKYEALESRCLSNVMTHRTRSDVPIILPRRFHSEALGLRNQLLSFRMDFRPKLQNYEYGPDLMDDSPEDRVNEVIAPIKVLAIDDNAPLRLTFNEALPEAELAEAAA